MRNHYYLNEQTHRNEAQNNLDDYFDYLHKGDMIQASQSLRCHHRHQQSADEFELLSRGKAVVTLKSDV